MLYAPLNCGLRLSIAADTLHMASNAAENLLLVSSQHILSDHGGNACTASSVGPLQFPPTSLFALSPGRDAVSVSQHANAMWVTVFCQGAAMHVVAKLKKGITCPRDPHDAFLPGL